jgi:hypothetical protein
MGDLIQELLQQRNASKVDGSHLEMLGKQAAELWGEGRVKNLSEAVVQTIKTAGLSSEQVRRVIEFTNIDAYNNEFKKEGAPNKVINFDGGPADPAIILADLNGGGRSNVFNTGNRDYATPPNEKTAGWFSGKPVSSTRQALPRQVQKQQATVQVPLSPEHAALADKYLLDHGYVADEVDALQGFGPDAMKALEHNLAFNSAMQKHFGGPGVDWDEQRWGRPHPDIPQQKMAHINLRDEREFVQMFTTQGGDYPEVNPYGDVIDLRDKLANEHDRITSELGQHEVDFQVLSQKLLGHVKQAALSGHSLSEIVHIWDGVAPDSIFVKSAMDGMLEKLIDNGVFTSESMVESLQKIASHRVPDPNHPLVADFASYCDTLSKLAAVREMQEEVANAMGDLTAFIKAAFTVGDAGKAVGGAAGKVWDLAGKGGDVVGRFAGGALGNEARGGKIGNFAGKAALLTGGALGANEAYRRTLKYDPTFQQGLGFVREMTPGTNEYYNKEYQLAMGG